MSVRLATEIAEHIEEATVANQNGARETSHFEMRLAGVKATLYAAEQQRIANLIALATNPDLIDPITDTWEVGFWEEARKEIMKGLNPE